MTGLETGREKLEPQAGYEPKTSRLIIIVSYGSVGFWADLVLKPRIPGRVPEWLSRRQVLLIIIVNR